MRRALLLLQGQADWKQEVKRRRGLAWGSRLALARRRLALQPALALQLALALHLALAPLAR